MNSWMKKLFDASKKDNTRRTHQRQQDPVTARKSPQSFQAVSIYSRSDCCEAAQRITGKKFLAAHAPQLPLGGCDQPAQCRCRYKHMSDRREEMRRDTDNGLPARQMLNGERRNRRDRRHHFVS
ncbi:MAG: hypothetical protein V2I41_21250 [Pseudomonadales bacterium]|jgi:hypothetical protein|nr:hypothetical protein [Pseudomonadales bacterium]